MCHLHFTFSTAFSRWTWIDRFLWVFLIHLFQKITFVDKWFMFLCAMSFCRTTVGVKTLKETLLIQCTLFFFFLQWWLGAYCITLHMSMSVKKAIQKALKNQSTSDKTALCGDLKGCVVCSSTQAVLIFSCVNFQGPKGNRGEQGPMGLPVSLWTSICFIYNKLYISPAEWCTFVMLHCDIWLECLTYDNIINLLVIHNIALNDLCF